MEQIKSITSVSNINFVWRQLCQGPFSARTCHVWSTYWTWPPGPSYCLLDIGIVYNIIAIIQCTQGTCGIGNLQGIANLRVITHLEMTISGCPLLWTSCNKLIKILGLKASCKKSSLFTKCPFLSESATRGLSQLVCGFGVRFLLCSWPKRKFELSRWRFVILASWT